MNTMKMMMLTGFASLAAAGMAVPASATPMLSYNTGDLSGTFGNDKIAKGNFSNTFNLIFAPGTAAFTLTSVAVSKITNITNLKGVFDGTAFDVVSDGVFDYQQLGPIDVNAASHTLTISGNSAGAGSYSGVIAFSAVPEPASWALMIGGFGIVGGTLRRRRSVSTKVSFA